MEQLKQIQKYYDDSYLFQHPSLILNVTVQEKLIRLLLSENIFHPQGGGQPDDEGEITVNQEQFKVSSLYNDKTIQSVFLTFEYQQHLLELLEQAKESNSFVVQQINEQKRKLYAQLHSGGHFLDMAVKKIGLKWIPSKGHHFPDGSYVEYIGTIEGKAEEIQAQLQQQCDILIQETNENDGKKVEYLNEEQLSQKLGEIPPYLKGAQNVRFVQLSLFDNGCPCGGTHVNHIREIEGKKCKSVVQNNYLMKSIFRFTQFRTKTYNQSLPYLEQTKFDTKNPTAILMLNLGGPNSAEEISPFLVRFFEDSTVIRIPFGLGPYIAKLRGPAKINKQYEKIGGFSPLLKWTMVQGILTTKPEGCGFLPAFRYGLPLQEDAIEYAFEKTEGRIKKFLLLSQYPQYSCSTGGNAIRNAIEVLQKYKTLQPDLEVSVIDSWHKNKFYISAMASILNTTIKSHNFNPKETLILFSAHSLPADFVWDGEKYPYYIYESCQLTVDALKNLGCQVHFDLGYQSKVGLNKWLRPATQHLLKQLITNSKFKNIILSPMGFTSDHLETLYELDIQLMEELQNEIKSHNKTVVRSASLNDHPQFIAALSDLVVQGLGSKKCGSHRERCVDCKFQQCDIVNTHNL